MNGEREKRRWTQRTIETQKIRERGKVRKRGEDGERHGEIRGTRDGRGGSGKGQAEIFWGDGVELGIWQVQGGGVASNY